MKRGKLPQVQDRTEWHKSEKGCWSSSLGRRGCRVRISQREPGAEFFRVVWRPGQGKVQASLKTASRPEAKRRVEAFLRALEEENPSRPVSNYDRYIATRQAMQTLAAQAPQKRGRKKWIRLELALFLAEATGRRIGSIRGLRWKDIDFTTPSIRWNPAFDKRGRETTIPTPAEMAETLKQFRAKLEAFDDGWLFPTASGDGPWDDDLFSQGLRKAERVAKLSKLRGSLRHALRRKWAIEHKDEPLSDVMAVGGWKDPKTLLACYQLADEAVMSVPKKLAAAKSGT